MRSITLAMLAWGVCLIATMTAAEEETPKPVDRWINYYKEIAKGYDIRVRSSPNERLELVEAPIIVYANPTSGRETHGAIFAWTKNGRAEVVAAIWSHLTNGAGSPRRVNHEFCSLSMEPLEAKGKEGVNWAPEKAGIELKVVPDGPVPAASRALRLTQMREITRQLSGFDRFPKNVGSGDAERTLRVLPTPLLRYPDDEARKDLNDGAVFGYFHDWDPEILLVLEIRDTADGPRWHYGVGYVDNKPLRLEYKGAKIWEKADEGYGSEKSNYYISFGVAMRASPTE